MSSIDVFNGDADGICALIQLRLAQPKVASLVTGVKRDIQLLDKVNAERGDQLTVLDISLQKNSQRVVEFLSAGVDIFYVDHHQAGDIPSHPQLQALIDTDSAVCTSLLMNRYLQGQFPLWAITAAYGDNLDASAEQLANSLLVSAKDCAQLQALGIYVNYNSYGDTLNDLSFDPASLYQTLAVYPSPLDFMVDNPGIFNQLQSAYAADMAKATQLSAEYEDEAVAVFMLPDAPWARRVVGVFGNYLCGLHPNKAHAVLTNKLAGGFVVSVRAPLINRVGADSVCAGFASGGGRKAAAGINHLPPEQLTEFVRRFSGFYRDLLA